MRIWLLFLILATASFPLSRVLAQVDAMPYTLQADNFSFDDNNGSMSANGAVEISNGKQKVQADSLEYNQKADIVEAKGNVVFTDSDGQSIFVDELTLTENLKQATLVNLRLHVEGLGEVMQATSGQKEDAIYTLNDVTYSPCKECNGKTKPWNFNAKQITYDTEKHVAHYKNAVLDAYGIPILYLPYFRHPLGTQDPQNGLLPPTFGHSTNLGNETTLSYYHYFPENNTDYTLRTRAMSSKGIMGMLERRQENINSNSEIKTSFINDTDKNTWRGYANVKGEYILKKGRRIGINGELSSDDTYLNEYFTRTDSYLPSTVYAEDASNNHYLGFYSTFYQDLETTRDPANTAQILPRIQFERVFTTDNQGGQIILSADALALHRSTGIRSRRVIAMSEYIKPWNLAGGNRLTLSTQIRGDFYNTDGTSDNGNTLRGLGHVSMLWERPMLSSGGNHLIIPMAMAIFAPRGGNSEDIPNEDSVNYELDINNLFSTNRFAGLDRV